MHYCQFDDTMDNLDSRYNYIALRTKNNYISVHWIATPNVNKYEKET
jgi:hypothetical protein